MSWVLDWLQKDFVRGMIVGLAVGMWLHSLVRGYIDRHDRRADKQFTAALRAAQPRSRMPPKVDS